MDARITWDEAMVIKNDLESEGKTLPLMGYAVSLPRGERGTIYLGDDGFHVSKVSTCEPPPVKECRHARDPHNPRRCVTCNAWPLA